MLAGEKYILRRDTCVIRTEAMGPKGLDFTSNLVAVRVQFTRVHEETGSL